VLTLWAERPECLWDEALPIEVRELPDDLAALDQLLSDPELASSDSASGCGRTSSSPSIRSPTAMCSPTSSTTLSKPSTRR
jgi:hypothetical protein